jgi:serine phosphatase RsbU (regulator of sigma subunit)
MRDFDLTNMSTTVVAGVEAVMATDGFHELVATEDAEGLTEARVAESLGEMYARIAREDQSLADDWAG